MTSQPTEHQPSVILQPLDVLHEIPAGVTVTIGQKPYAVAEDGKFIPLEDA